MSSANLATMSANPVDSPAMGVTSMNPPVGGVNSVEPQTIVQPIEAGVETIRIFVESHRRPTSVFAS